MKYLGVIKNRYINVGNITEPEDFWINKSYRVRLDGGEWTPIKSYKSLCMASLVELAIVFASCCGTDNLSLL